MSEAENGRLVRIEEKVDTLTEAISRLAVVDARLSDFIQANSRISTRISELEKLSATHTSKIEIQDVKLEILVKICWLLGAGVITTLWSAFSKVIGIG